MTILNRFQLVRKCEKKNLEDVTEVDLSSMKINTINNDAFEGMTSLIKLVLSQNDIAEIDSRVFSGLKNLTELNFSDNKLKRIESDTFSELPNLEILYLEYNQIDEINSSCFEYNTKLKNIILNGNQISSIHQNAFFGLTDYLEYLCLRFNHLNMIKSEYFTNLVNLKSLNLAYNRLKKIDPNSFKNLTLLETLELNNNQLMFIDSRTFRNLFSLKSLNLSNNKLTSIEPNIFRELEKLETLYLNNNLITSIDRYSLKGPINLQVLKLNNNKISYIETDSFDSFKSIQVIQLYGNPAFSSMSFYNQLEEKDKSSIEEPILPEIDISTASNTELKAFVSTPSFEGVAKNSFEAYRLEENGFLSDWNEFLKKSKIESEKQQKRLIMNKDNTDINQIIRNSFIQKELPSLEKRAKTNMRTKISNFVLDLITSRDNLLDKYQVKKPLGHGSFGNAYLVNDIQATKQEKVMKILDFGYVNFDSNELRTLLQTKNENVLQYLELSNIEISSNKHSIIITEFCESDLKKEIENNRRTNSKISDDKLLDWTTQIANGLKFLHVNNIIHRDIKPGKLLLKKGNEKEIIKIGIIKIDKKALVDENYMSPEYYKSLTTNNVDYSFSTDIWSLGCVLYELITCKYAFPYGQKSYPPVPSLKEPEFNKRTIELLSNMLNKDAKSRIDASKLFTKLQIMDETENDSDDDSNFQIHNDPRKNFV